MPIRSLFAYFWPKPIEFAVPYEPKTHPGEGIQIRVDFEQKPKTVLLAPPFPTDTIKDFRPAQFIRLETTVWFSEEAKAKIASLGLQKLPLFNITGYPDDETSLKIGGPKDTFAIVVGDFFAPYPVGADCQNLAEVEYKMDEITNAFKKLKSQLSTTAPPSSVEI